MPAFLFAFVAVALVSLGGRDQMLVARLAASLGQSAGLLLAGMAASILSAALMAWAGPAIAGLLPGPAKTMLVAIALIIAAVELAWPVRSDKPSEPTRSLAAIFVVLLARQTGDAARFIVFALAAAFPVPLLAGAGGALAGIAALALGWGMGRSLEGRWLRPARVAMAAVLAVSAVAMALAAREIVG